MKVICIHVFLVFTIQLLFCRQLNSDIIGKQQTPGGGDNAIVGNGYQTVRLKSFKTPRSQGGCKHRIKGYALAGSKTEHQRFGAELFVGEFFFRLNGN